MTPGQSPYADGDFVGSPDDRPPQDPIDGLNSAGPIEHLAPVVPIHGAKRDTRYDPRFDREGRLERLRERREANGYAGPATKAPTVDPEVAVGKQRAPWADVEGWIREQANPKLKGAPSKAHLYRLADDMVTFGRWLADNTEQMTAQAKEAGKGQPGSPRTDGTSAGNAELTPVEAAASGPPDPDDGLFVVMDYMVRAGNVIVACQRYAGSNMARRAEERPFYDDGPPRGDCPGLEDGEECTCRPDQASAGHCMACGQWASGAEGDRITSGICERSCRSAMRRWLAAHPDNPERSAFIRDRRAYLEAKAAEEAAIQHEDELADRRARKARDQGRRRAA